MSEPIRIPEANHSVTIAARRKRVVVTVAGRLIADTARALTLVEGSSPPVFYIPREDVDMALLERTDRATYCPHKGECAYYSIPIGGKRSVNAAWSYEAPYAAAAAIKGHLAFCGARVDAIVEWPVEYPLALPGHDLALGPMQHTGQ